MTGGGRFGSTTEGSVSPLVCTISVGPFVDVFSIIGIRSNRADLDIDKKEAKTNGEQKKKQYYSAL